MDSVSEHKERHKRATEAALEARGALSRALAQLHRIDPCIQELDEALGAVDVSLDTLRSHVRYG